MNPSGSPVVLCPYCGAQNRGAAADCFLCGHPLAGAKPGKPDAAPLAEREHRLPSFRLGTLMLLIALAAVVLGVWHENPFLGFALAIVSAVALVQAMRARKRDDGRPVTTARRVGVFLATFVAFVVTAISTFIACFASCLAVAESAPGYSGIIPGLVVGGVAAIVTLVVMVRMFQALGRRMSNLGQAEPEP